MSWFEDYEDMRMECDECHTVINFHEEDIHDGTHIVCPRCGKHIELEGCQNPKMVNIETVKDWLYTNFFEYEDNSYFGGGYVKLETVFNTFEEMMENFNKTIGE